MDGAKKNITESNFQHTIQVMNTKCVSQVSVINLNI